jgi:hypothetical protein
MTLNIGLREVVAFEEKRLVKRALGQGGAVQGNFVELISHWCVGTRAAYVPEPLPLFNCIAIAGLPPS